jgi:hypothetical protein
VCGHSCGNDTIAHWSISLKKCIEKNFSTFETFEKITNDAEIYIFQKKKIPGDGLCRLAYTHTPVVGGGENAAAHG